MYTTQLFKEKKIVYSLEVFPPKKSSSVDTIYNTLSEIRYVPCDFISVTCGAGGSEAQKNKTCEIASLIKSEYKKEPVAHLTCVNTSKDELIVQLEDLKKNGIENILALRGDRNPDIEPKNDFKYASELVEFIKLNYPEFNLIGACYPEYHQESASPEQDIKNLKHKVDAGVSHLLSQLFFDNEIFYRFVEKTQKAGINVPIEAGIMPITTKSQIEHTITMCGASVPARLAKMFSRYADSPIALRDAGIYYATEQIMDLISNGVRGIHLYTMNNVRLAERVTDNVKNIILCHNR